MSFECKSNKQGDNIQPWHTLFPIWKQSVVPCPVLTIVSSPAYRFLKRQIRWSGIPISWRVFHSLLWSTQSKALAQSIKQRKWLSIQKLGKIHICLKTILFFIHLTWFWIWWQSHSGKNSLYVVVVQSLSLAWIFVTPMDTPGFPVLHHLPEVLKLMSIESVMSSNHPVLCRPLLLLPSIFLSIRVISKKSALCIRWPKYWNFNFSISPSKEYSGLISFRIDWFDFLTV